MDHPPTLANRLDDLVEVMTRAVYGAFLLAVAVGLLCLMTLCVAATYAALHPGDDLPPLGEGGGDMIMPFR